MRGGPEDTAGAASWRCLREHTFSAAVVGRHESEGRDN
jgi:hypothetical protein